MSQARYIEASIKGRVLFFVIVGLFAVGYFFTDMLNLAFPLPEEVFLHIEAVDFRNLLSAIFASCIISLVIYYVVLVAISARRHMEFPTPSMNIPIRQRVQAIAKPSSIWLVASVVIVPLAFQFLVMWYSWYSWHKLLPGGW
jgi:hypothetical protein